MAINNATDLHVFVAVIFVLFLFFLTEKEHPTLFPAIYLLSITIG